MTFEEKSLYPFGSYPKPQISDLVVLAVSFSIRDILSSVSKGDGKYQYSFNGIEKDNELKGEGNSLDFGARIYDSRLGRWQSVDLLMQFNSNYSAMGNNPILLFDIDGNWVPGVDDKGRMFLIAEKGDNAKTLIQFYNNDMVFFKTNFKSWHRTYKPGEIQLIENNTTESKAYRHAKANPNIYKIPKDFFDTKYIKNYNGFAFANMVSNQLSFENNWRTTMSPSSFDNILKRDYNKNTVPKPKSNGTIYELTKNGMQDKHQRMELEEKKTYMFDSIEKYNEKTDEKNKNEKQIAAYNTAS